MTEEGDTKIHSALVALGLISEGDKISRQALTGGVASDIWRVDLPGRTLCVKSALSTLRVEQDWQVSVDRNHYEVLWLKHVSSLLPGAVPRVIAESREAGLFAMEYFAEDRYPNWKSQLSVGIIDADTARRIAEYLAQIHNATASNEAIAGAFDRHDLFFDLRIDPYLLATAKRHEAVAPVLLALADDLASRHVALVHGDVSPKNILVGEEGPIILDAECACYGDPAFDVAFLLNHMLLKSILRPKCLDALLECFDAVADAYLPCVRWENSRDLEHRVCRLLSGLLLARVDGKSPVEYIQLATEKEFVRAFAFECMEDDITSLGDLGREWSNKHRAHKVTAKKGNNNRE
jgi:aminoglycoside phosphotransferase (APT) family kinase protein